MTKLTRDIFLYMDPHAPTTRFSQCSTCRDWIVDRHCVIHGPKVIVPGTASCGLYVWGHPKPRGTESFFRVTPTESGLVNRKVRCQNCIWFDETERTCSLYQLLNKNLPESFDLDENVDEHGCCNAQQRNSSKDE